MMEDVFVARDEVVYAKGAIVSKTVIKKATGTITLFAFDKGEELSEHSAPYEALVQVLDGKGQITVGDKPHLMEPGNCILLPANVPHAVKAVESFKMMLTMIKG